MNSSSSISKEEKIKQLPAEITDTVPIGIKFISNYDENFFPAFCNPLEQTYDDIDTIKKSKTRPVKMMSTQELKSFSEILLIKVQHALNEDLTGKITQNVLFHGEVVSHHFIPYLVNNSDLYAPGDWNQFTQATSLVDRYVSLQDKYKNVATDKVIFFIITSNLFYNLAM